MFVWLTYSQTLAAVIAGCEAAWTFFGGALLRHTSPSFCCGASEDRSGQRTLKTLTSVANPNVLGKALNADRAAAAARGRTDAAKPTGARYSPETAARRIGNVCRR